MFFIDNEETGPVIDELESELRPKTEGIFRQIDRSLTGFPLPVGIKTHDEYDEKVIAELKRYLQFIRDTPALMGTPKLFDEVQEIVEKLSDALQNERRGDTGKALDAVKSILIKYREDPFFVSDLDSNYAFRGSAPVDELKSENFNYDTQLTYPLSFFRCRRNEEIKSRSEMLHVPLTKRSLCSSNRFSLPGIPCLYIASTTYCCWKELGEPADMSAVAFRVNEHGKKLKILNLVISQRLIDGLDHNPYCPMSELAFKMRVLFPLVIATSISEFTHDKCGYIPQYTISHLIMRCLKELDIDGVAYQSTRIDDEFQFPHGVNVAIPIFSESAQGKYGEICRCFEITDPISFNSIQKTHTAELVRTQSYINAVFSDGSTSTVECSGKRVPYSATPFSVFDNILVGKSYYPALE